MNCLELKSLKYIKSSSSDAGLVALAGLTVILAISTIVLGLAFYKKRGTFAKIGHNE